MNVLLAAAEAPKIDWAGLSPLLAVLGGSVVVLLMGLLRSRVVREVAVPVLTIVSLGAFIGLSIWQWGEPKDLISNSLRSDDMALYLNLLFGAAGIATVLLSWRAQAPREAAHGEYHAMLLTSIAGMAVLVAAQDTVALFIGFELLSIPLYVLCATEMRRATSLESGLKYLIIGSVGSATLVYGLALLYGAAGTTSYTGIARAMEGGIAEDELLLAALALTIVGLAFKASVAPFHQWTPDVYEGAPTPITAFMAVATKAAAFGALLRLFDGALLDAQADWGPLLAILATVTIIVGNVGALGQSSLKRLLAWSSVAQAGYLLAGVVVGTRLGLQATLFYLAVYVAMNLAAFAVIVARERETGLGDHIDSVAGIGASRPWLAWPMTIAMLALAGIPATGGFIAKLYVIDASVDGGYAWLGIVIVLGSAVSLAYYLRVIAAMWMRPAAPPNTVAGAVGRGDGGIVSRPALAGGSQDAEEFGPAHHPHGPDDDAGPGSVRAGDPPVEITEDFDTNEPLRLKVQPEVAFVAVAAGLATLALGIVPGPLFELARDAGVALTNLL